MIDVFAIPPTHPPFLRILPPLSLSLCLSLFICLVHCMCFLLSVSRSVLLINSLFILFIYVCLLLCLSVCPSACLCLSVSLPVSQSVRLFIRLLVGLTMPFSISIVSLSAVCLPVCMYGFPFRQLSNCLCGYLAITAIWSVLQINAYIYLCGWFVLSVSRPWAVNFVRMLSGYPLKFLTDTSFFVAASDTNYLNINHAHYFTQLL